MRNREDHVRLAGDHLFQITDLLTRLKLRICGGDDFDAEINQRLGNACELKCGKARVRRVHHQIGGEFAGL